MRFSGTITQKIDGKGRVSIPADFRRVLETGDPSWTPDVKRVKMRVVYGDPDRRCLEVYPIHAYEDMLERVALLPEGDEDREILEIILVAGSDEVEVDPDGRTVLGKDLRDHLGLHKDGGEAVFVGSLDTFRIWTAEEWAAERSRKLAAARARLPGAGNPMKLLPKKPES